MTGAGEDPSTDIWAEWVLGRSHGGDPEQRRRSAQWLVPIRDRVLANGAVRPGERLSVFEPISRWFPDSPDRFWAYDVSAVREIAAKVKGAYRAMAPNPRVPTVEEAMREALTPEEAAAFEAHLRPLVDAGDGVHRSAHAYLRARKSS